MSESSHQPIQSRLLARQVRRLLGGTVPPGLEAFVASVDEAYRQFDAERELLERSLNLTSEELVVRNNRLSSELEAGRQMQAALQSELAERRRAEQELRRSMFRLSEARRVFGMGYWEMNLRTGSVVWSDEMYKLFGYAPGEVAASRRLFARHCHPGDWQQMSRSVRFARPDQVVERDFRIRRVDGEECVVRVSGMRTKDEGDSMLLGICYDITRQRRYEEALVEARERAEQARCHAEELLRLKSTLLDNISHELRTPLAAIIGFADILSSDLTGEQKEFATLIHQSGERLLDTFNSVLTLASFDSGQARMDLKLCDLATEAREAVEMMRVGAERKGLQLRFEADERVYATADTGALHRILHNLIGNAVKFTEKGYVCVRVKAPSKGQPASVIEVSDTGIGIDDAFVPYVFEAFHQQSKGMSRAHEGAGLGLTIVKKLVELMDGTVEVQSRVGEGTTFRVTLPVSEPALRLVVGSQSRADQD